MISKIRNLQLELPSTYFQHFRYSFKQRQSVPEGEALLSKPTHSKTSVLYVIFFLPNRIYCKTKTDKRLYKLGKKVRESRIADGIHEYISYSL